MSGSRVILEIRYLALHIYVRKRRDSLNGLFDIFVERADRHSGGKPSVFVKSHYMLLSGVLPYYQNISETTVRTATNA